MPPPLKKQRTDPLADPLLDKWKKCIKLFRAAGVKKNTIGHRLLFEDEESLFYQLMDQGYHTGNKLRITCFLDDRKSCVWGYHYHSECRNCSEIGTGLVKVMLKGEIFYVVGNYYVCHCVYNK